MGNRRITIEEITLEAHVAGTGRAWLELCGWQVHRLQADKHAAGGNRKAHEKELPGTPDYICWIDIPELPVYLKQLPYTRFMFYWEAKRTLGGKVRESQHKWREDHPKAIVCYAKSFEDLKRWIKSHFPLVKILDVVATIR